MIDAFGTITALDSEYAIVKMDETGCGRCNEEGGCGGNNLGKMLCSAPRTFRVLNPKRSAIGDRVTIAIAEGAVRRSAVLVYAMPLLALFAGAFCGTSVAGEAGAIFGAVSGLLLAWLGLRYVHRRPATDQNDQPYIRY